VSKAAVRSRIQSSYLLAISSIRVGQDIEDGGLGGMVTGDSIWWSGATVVTGDSIIYN